MDKGSSKAANVRHFPQKFPFREGFGPPEPAIRRAHRDGSAWRTKANIVGSGSEAATPHDYVFQHGIKGLYELLGSGALKASKLGAKTLIDVECADSFFGGLPSFRGRSR